MAVIDVFSERSTIEIVSKIMKWCDYYAAKFVKFIAYSLIFTGCIVFYSVAEIACYWLSVLTAQINRWARWLFAG